MACLPYSSIFTWIRRASHFLISETYSKGTGGTHEQTSYSFYLADRGCAYERMCTRDYEQQHRPEFKLNSDGRRCQPRVCQHQRV